MTNLEENQIKVIGYENSIISSESGKKLKKIKNNSITPKIAEKIDKVETLENTTSKKCKPRDKIIAFVSIVVAIILVIVLCVVLIPSGGGDDQNPPPSIKGIVNPEEERKLGSEFTFNTKAGDVQKITVTQKSKEDRVNDGHKITTYSTRITNYIISILSEKDSDEENKYYYDKIYECSISIESECFSSTEEDCTPKDKLNLSKPTRRARNLEVNEDKLKDAPIPFCLFNLTNNDVITSIACLESLPETKLKKIVLDLYFYRPPGIKRLKDQNINSPIIRRKEGNKIFIRERNDGICDIENAHFSHCSTDMNTTTDLNNNILTYDELAEMNVTKDDKNYYIKSKRTNLVDVTNKTENLDKESYKNNLDKLSEKLKPYLKSKVLFSKDKFEEYYYLIKKNDTYFEQKRKLQNPDEDKEMVLKENYVLDIFSPTSGISVDVTLLNNGGFGNEIMQANNLFYLDNKKIEDISKSEESSKSLKQILKDLILLTDAGNHKTTELFQNTNITFERLTEEINKDIISLNRFVKYKDLTDIFDSTSSFDVPLDLPFIIVQETDDLKKKLEEILENIENGGIKNNIKILNTNIYDYIEESHKIINDLFNNLNELSKSLSSPKSLLTEISTYYLRNTTTSYTSTIKEAEDILTNYYKNEYNLILPQVEKILIKFEEKMDESIEKEMKIIKNLYEKIENKNYTIKESNDEHLRTILNNLYYIKNFLEELKEKIIKKVRNELDLKSNGYFISDYDLNSNQNSFNTILEKIKKIVKQLDNDELIDVCFDEVMRNINNNFTSILKYADKQKEELFPLSEDVLKAKDFKTEFQNEIKNKISDSGVQIFTKINRENNYFLEKKQNIIDEFIKNNKNELDNIIIKLDNIFSIVKIEELAHLYELAFNSSLQKTKNEIVYNMKLAEEYFNTLSNQKQLLKLLKTYLVDEKNLPYCTSRTPAHEVYLTCFEDAITSIKKSSGYINKYNIFKEFFEKSRLFVNNEIYKDLLSEYKTFMLKIREILQVFKNNKMSDKYPDLNELSFIDEHMRIIDNFYNRFDTYVTDDAFNDKYIDYIEEFKKNENKDINKDLNTVESYHKIINKYPLHNKEFSYDICLTFIRRKTYTCVNGVVSYIYSSYEYCLPAANLSLNYLKLKDHSIDSDLTITKFRLKLLEFHNSLSENIYLYTSKINKLKQSLLNLEKETLDQKITLDYLSPIQNYISSIILNNYGDNIIISSYNYYQSLMESRVDSILNDISNKWYKYFDDIYTDIDNNLLKFNNSIIEFSNKLRFYSTILSLNITKNFYDSIEIQVKGEFNYTIKYYYNILLKSVKSAYQYVISKLPLNPVGFNNIIQMRKKEVNEVFTKLINDIKSSLEYALNFDNQLYVIQVPETNFFNTNDILKNNVINTQKTLAEKIAKIMQLKNRKVNDEFSLSARFYLENSDSGRQITELYEQIDKKVFVHLNLERFKELLYDNWIFDQDEFIRSLKELLYNSDLEVKKELNTEKEKYIKLLEKEITKTYTKEDISKKINELYLNEIINLNKNQIEEIEQIINDILNKIKEEMEFESKDLKEKASSLNKDYSKIENRLLNYKNYITQKMNEVIFSVINQFNQDIIEKIYTNFFEANLNTYISESEKAITELKVGEIKLLSNNYNIGQIILNIIKNLCKEYKIFIKTEIDSNYNKYMLILKESINIEYLEKKIIEQIDKNYNEILLKLLKEVAINEIGIQGYNPYDFKDDTIKRIDDYIETKLNNIQQIMEKTKGKNYNFDMRGWKKMDFSLVYQNIQNNCNSLSVFINSEKDNEKEHVDIFLKDIMKLNFNDLLKNIIPTFGNDFFERIIKYNENFKITSLYNTLRYSIISTLAYYRTLYGSAGKIKALTKDLKLKIYSLNDLDLIAQKRNNEVLNLLNKKVDEFITDSKDFLTDKYIEFFRNDNSIETNFTGIVRQEILDNLIELRTDFNKDYLDLMNEYFKDKLITIYTQTINKETKNLVLSVEELRESLKVNIDDIFSLNPDEVLNDINNKMNNTLASIYKYNNHFDTFKISENLVTFLNYYGSTNIQSKFSRILNIFNEATKNGIGDAIENNADDFKNYFDFEEFIKKTNNIRQKIDQNYFDNLNNSIYNYGIEQYPNKLEAEITRQAELHNKNKRRNLNQEEIDNINKEKIADKAIDETFKRILSSSLNAKTFIYSLNHFDDFDIIIDENINKLNIAYKQSLQRIKVNNFPEDIYNNLTSKITELKNSTLDYYNNIKITYYRLKNYLQESINEINNDLKKCANITYQTFAEKYNDYTNISINSINNENIGEITDSKIIDNQAKITVVNYTISKIQKDTQFLFKVDFEDGELKKPRAKATIINKSKPGILKLKFIDEKEDQGDIIERIEAEINNVNFSMDFYYTTASKDINVITTTNFESFNYGKDLIQLIPEEKEECDYIDLFGYVYENCYYVYDYSENNYNELEAKKEITIEQKNIIEEGKIPESILFEES